MSGAATDGAKGDKEWRPAANPWLIALVVTMVAFMEILDTTIVNVALPHIAGSLSASTDDATWTLTSYLVANGIVLPISGWLGSLLGRKRYFLICIGMFTLCSFLCGTSTSLAELIIFRLLQGLFGGGLQPNQQSIILDTFPPAKRGTAFAVTAVATIVAPVLGPTLGGWITDSYSWRWIFFINIPIGLLTFFGVAALVEDPPWLRRAQAQARRIDYPGLALIALGFGCLQVFMDRGEDDDWFGSPFITGMAIMAAICLCSAVVWLWYEKQPVVNIHVFADRNFAVGCVMIFCMAAVLYSSAVVIPQLAQQVLGYTATLAGLVLSPGALLVCFLIPLVGRVMPLVQTRFLIAFGFFALGMALVFSHRLTPDIDFTELVLMRGAQTFGLAFLFVPISVIAYSTLPKELNSDAAALFTMFRNLAGSIGISAATAMVAQRTQVRMAYLTDYLNPFNQAYNTLVERNAQQLLSLGAAAGSVDQRAVGMVYQTLRGQASLMAYMDVFGICAIIAFCVVPLAFLFSGSTASGSPGAAH
ncbi:MAG: DHA2 family efflux MFS transporter permease subunit [Acidisphaera sp.]|nr:DHA2 family efflux MFS transporter permease subunit [Acidisphaera sp.]